MIERNRGQKVCLKLIKRLQDGCNDNIGREIGNHPTGFTCFPVELVRKLFSEILRKPWFLAVSRWRRPRRGGGIARIEVERQENLDAREIALATNLLSPILENSSSTPPSREKNGNRILSRLEENRLIYEERGSSKTDKYRKDGSKQSKRKDQGDVIPRCPFPLFFFF